VTDWDLFDRPAPLVNMASRSFLRLGERRVKPHGFSIGQLPVLYLLRDGKAMSQRDSPAPRKSSSRRWRRFWRAWSATDWFSVRRCRAMVAASWFR
jgi:hypothetical protein